jgi:S-adenosylmethionine decarboxylase
LKASGLKSGGQTATNQTATNQTATSQAVTNQTETTQAPDALMQRGDKVFAGLHLTVDLYDASRLDDIAYIESVMLECIQACEATLLHIHLHHFTPNNGVTGVAVLAESHISVHTWPERNFAAFDLFMCGTAQPERAIEILNKRFKAGSNQVNLLQRGEQLTIL